MASDWVMVNSRPEPIMDIDVIAVPLARGSHRMTTHDIRDAVNKVLDPWDGISLSVVFRRVSRDELAGITIANLPVENAKFVVTLRRAITGIGVVKKKLTIDATTLERLGESDTGDLIARKVHQAVRNMKECVWDPSRVRPRGANES